MTFLDIKDLTYSYPEAKAPSLRNVNLSIESGEWVLLQGSTGCGKSTLLRCITGACPAFYGGRIHGQVAVNGSAVERLTAAERVRTLGFVSQHPEAQSVATTVGNEVAFALENIGVPESDMQWRVAEALAIVGLTGFAGTPLEQLSGGQRQRVALASALVHQPTILLLDEPTSQLDPVASDEWLDILARLNQEFGMTIIMSEHRIDKLYGQVNRVVYMEHGEVYSDGTPQSVANVLRNTRRDAAPVLARLFPEREDPVLTVRDARLVVRDIATASRDVAASCKGQDRGGATALQARKLSAHYEGTRTLTLNQCNFSLRENKLTALIGPNGSGKSTLLRVLAGLLPVYEGRLSGTLLTRQNTKRLAYLQDRSTVSYLPQNPFGYFSQTCVRNEVALSLRLQGVDKEEMESRVDRLLTSFDLRHLAERSPRDLSGGEQLRVAVASAVAPSPRFLLLDEPTRGLDAGQKQQLGDWLQNADCTVLLATHDMDFVARNAEDVLFLHHGEVVLSGAPQEVFQRALYFAPVIARAMRLTVPSVVCIEDAVLRGLAR